MPGAEGEDSATVTVTISGCTLLDAETLCCPGAGTPEDGTAGMVTVTTSDWPFDDEADEAWGTVTVTMSGDSPYPGPWVGTETVAAGSVMVMGVTTGPMPETEIVRGTTEIV